MMNTCALDDISVSSSFNLDEVKQCYDRWGTAVIPGWLDHQRLEKIREEYEQILKQSKQYHSFSYERGQGCSIDRSTLKHKEFPTLQEVFTDPKMQQLVDHYVLKPNMMNYEIYATFDHTGGGIIAPTHFDKLWSFKFMLYLDDMPIGKGNFGVIPGSSHFARNRFRKIFEENNLKELDVGEPLYLKMSNESLPPELGEVVDITGPAGTLIIFETDTCHRAGYLSEGQQRRILRGHSGPQAVYKRVKKFDRQWWRGEMHRAAREEVIVE